MMCTASIWHRLSVEAQRKILEYVRKLLDGQLSRHAFLDEHLQILAQENQLDGCWDISLRNSAEVGTYVVKNKVSDDIQRHKADEALVCRATSQAHTVDPQTGWHTRSVGHGCHQRVNRKLCEHRASQNPC